MAEDQLRKAHNSRDLWLALGLSLFAAIAFYFSTKATLHDLDYTNQIASALLHGQLGLQEKPPDWLNEMIPWEGRYYSAFPLGAVLSMLPVALLRNTGLIQTSPGHVLAALIAGLSVYFFFRLANAFKEDGSRRLRPSRPHRRSQNYVWPCFRFSELGHGVTSDSVAPGKSLLVWLCWGKPQRSISRWSGRLRSLQERSLPWRLEIAPSFLSRCLFTFIFFGGSQTKS